jgi:hypothetical protein
LRFVFNCCTLITLLFIILLQFVYFDRLIVSTNVVHMVLVGISRSARGYCINLVLETMKSYSSEDGLTEEALVTKLRTCRYHHLFLHTSLRNNSSGKC